MKAWMINYAKLYCKASPECRNASKNHWVNCLSKAYAENNEDLIRNAADHIAWIEYIESNIIND